MPAPPPEDGADEAADAGPPWPGLPLSWTDPDWAATPLPATATQPKLIPIVTTTPTIVPSAACRHALPNDCARSQTSPRGSAAMKSRNGAAPNGPR